MDNSATFGGSRSEFLPGEGYDDSDIKYQRYGGCFVSVKKGFIYVFLSIATVVVCCALVYFYAPRWKDRKLELNDDDIDTSSLIDLLKAPPDIHQVRKDRHNEEIGNKQKNIHPSKYKIFIQPYLDEDQNENFSFTGNVSIIFTIEKPTRTVILDAKGLTVIDPVILTYQSSSKPEKLIAESQVFENGTAEEENVEPVKVSDTEVKNETEKVEDTTNSPNDVVKEEEKKEEKKEEPTETTVEPAQVEPPKETPNEAPNDTETTTAAPENPPAQESPPVQENSLIPETNHTAPVNTTQESTSTSTTAAPTEDTRKVLPEKVITTTTTKPPQPVEIDVPPSLRLIKVLKVNKDNGKITIALDEKLQINTNYTITIQFKGALKSENGLVKFSYEDEGKTIWNVILNEDSGSQNIFPCLDDPMQKTPFQINVARRTSKLTLSNMPIKESIQHQTDSGWFWDVYQETPPLSLNALSFLIYNLVSYKIPSESGALVNMWARHSVLEKANYAFETAPKLLSFYNQFFGFHYPLTKLDLVAAPKLPKNCIAKFGLLLFGENIVKTDIESPNFEKLAMLKTMAHGFTKQWFGGLVNVEHKNESWIIDGLSTYMQYLGINNIEPNWEKLDDFILMTQDALNTDIDTTLIRNYLDSDYETRTIINKKACSIIRMLNNTLTDLVFIKALRTYIENWKYDSAEEGNLWTVLTKEGHENGVLPKDITIQNLIESWVRNDGFPVLEIDRNYDDGSVRISQVSESKRTIPITYITSKTTNFNIFPNLWITESPTNFKNISTTDDKWMLFNVLQTTPCRVNYDHRNWQNLIEQLHDNHKEIPTINRAQLIDDAFYFTKNGMLDYEVLVNLTNYLKGKEKDYLPWATVLKNFDRMYRVLYKTVEFGYFQDYILSLIKPLYTELGFETKDEDTYSTSSLRHLIVNWACRLNYKACRDKMYHKYQTWANFSNPDGTYDLDYELRPTMYCVGVLERGKSAWNFLWDRFIHPNVTNYEKKALLAGMGCAKDTWILLRYFQRTLNESEISLKDSETVWNTLPYDFASHEAFQFLREHWKEIQNHYGQHESLMKSILSGMLSKLSTKTELIEMTRFFYTHEELKTYGKFMAQAAKKIKNKLNWKEKYLEDFANSLMKYT